MSDHTGFFDEKLGGVGVGVDRVELAGSLGSEPSLQ